MNEHVRVAIVTGASSGLGKAIATGLAGAGHPVALVARSADRLASTARQIRDAGGVAVAVAADVTDADAVELLPATIGEQLGTPTIVVNAAGVFGPIQLIKDSAPAEWVAAVMVDAIAPYLVCRAFLSGMLGAGWGRIVNLTSAASLHPPGPLNSAYGTAKAALNQFTRHLAAELAGTGVTANVLHPGDVQTDMWADIRDRALAAGPAAADYQQWVRWVDETGGDPPRKAAEAVLRLCADSAADISGQFCWIDDPLQPPVPSWGTVADARPWATEQ